MSEVKLSERTEKRVKMLIDRGLYKQTGDVLDAAMELLIRHQMEIDSKKQAESYSCDKTCKCLQKKTMSKN